MIEFLIVITIVYQSNNNTFRIINFFPISILMKCLFYKLIIIGFITITTPIGSGVLNAKNLLELSLIEKNETNYVKSKEDLLNHIRLHKKRVNIYARELLAFLKKEKPEIYNKLSEDILLKMMFVHDNTKLEKDYFDMLFLLYGRDIKTLSEKEQISADKFINSLNKLDKKIQMELFAKYEVPERLHKYYFQIEKIVDEYDRYSEEVSRVEEFGREYIHPQNFQTNGSLLNDKGLENKVFLFLDSFRETSKDASKIKELSFSHIKKRNERLNIKPTEVPVTRYFNSKWCIKFFEQLP